MKEIWPRDFNSGKEGVLLFNLRSRVNQFLTNAPQMVIKNRGNSGSRSVGDHSRSVANQNKRCNESNCSDVLVHSGRIICIKYWQQIYPYFIRLLASARRKVMCIWLRSQLCLWWGLFARYIFRLKRVSQWKKSVLCKRNKKGHSILVILSIKWAISGPKIEFYWVHYYVSTKTSLRFIESGRLLGSPSRNHLTSWFFYIFDLEAIKNRRVTYTVD